MTWSLQRLSADHALGHFRCGEHRLDHFLKRHALDNNRRGLGSTYVAVDAESGKVLGYVTLSTNSIHFEHVPADLPRYPIPTVLIARLAVDRSARGTGLGTALMLEALHMAVEVAERAGVYAVTVDAMTERVKAWYKSAFGFTELLDDPLHLFITIADLRASGLPPRDEM